VTGGSGEVGGGGRPNQPNGCIQICLVGGPGRQISDPPCTDPDQTIGTGGTDENGNFVDSMGNPGIPVSPNLEPSDCIYGYDNCLDAVGPVTCVLPTAGAPALPRSGILIALGALLLVAFRALLYRSRV
jgi:hypothetical protein